MLVRPVARRDTARHLVWLAPLIFAYATVALAAPHTPKDETAYLAFAEHLTHGYYSGRGDDIELWFGPGLPLLLAPLVALGTPLELLRLLGPVLLFATVILFYFLVRLSARSSVALMGALALGLYWPTLRLLPTLYSELPAMFFVVCFMVAYTIDLRRPRAATLAAASASLALLALTRVVFGWVLVVTLALALISALVRRTPAARRLVVVTAVGLVLTTPWLAYTYSVTGKPFYWSTSGGLSLYWMSSPYHSDLGDWHDPSDVPTDANLAPHRRFFASLGGLNEVESDERLEARAAHQIREHPAEYIRNVAANMSRLWFSTPFSYTPQKLSTTFYLVPNAFILTFLLASALVVARDAARPSETLAFALLLIAGVGFQALLSGYARMLVPLLPLMLWFIVQAAVCVFDPHGRDERQPTRTAG